MGNQQVAIIRGPAGSGKSTAAKILAEEVGFVVVEADNFFVDSAGVYVYDRAKISLAQAQCLREFKNAVAEGKNVAVANTFVRIWEMMPYLEFCAERGIPFQVIECHGRFQNVHNVPDETVAFMRQHMEPFAPSTVLFELSSNFGKPVDYVINSRLLPLSVF